MTLLSLRAINHGNALTCEEALWRPDPPTTRRHQRDRVFDVDCDCHDLGEAGTTNIYARDATATKASSAYHAAVSGGTGPASVNVS